MVTHYNSTGNHFFQTISDYTVVVVGCHDQVRRQVSQGSRNSVVEVAKRANRSQSAIDPLVTSQSAVWCKRTGVSHLVVQLHSLYRCRLVRLTSYACSPAIDGSVLTVAVREYIVVFGAVSAPRPKLGLDAPSVLC